MRKDSTEFWYQRALLYSILIHHVLRSDLGAFCPGYAMVQLKRTGNVRIYVVSICSLTPQFFA